MFSGAVTRFLVLLPAMVVAALCLRGWGLFAGVPDGRFPHAPTARLVSWAAVGVAPRRIQAGRRTK